MITLKQSLQMYENLGEGSMLSLAVYENTIKGLKVATMSNNSDEVFDKTIGFLEKIPDLKGLISGKIQEYSLENDRILQADIFGIIKHFNTEKIIYHLLAFLGIPFAKWVYVALLIEKVIEQIQKVADFVEKATDWLNEVFKANPVEPVDPNAWSHSDMQEYTGSENSASENYDSSHIDEGFYPPKYHAPEDDAAYRSHTEYYESMDPNSNGAHPVPENDEVYRSHAEYYETVEPTSSERSLTATNPAIQAMSASKISSLENTEKIGESILEGVLLTTQHFSELGSFMFKLVSSFFNGFSKFARGLSHVFIGPIHEIESQFIGLSNSIVETLTTISNGTDSLFGGLNVNPISRIETFQQMKQSIMTSIEDRVTLENLYLEAFAVGLYPPVSALGIHENSTQTGGTSSSNETGYLYAQAIAANTQRMADTLELSNESLSILREKLGIAIVTEASKPDVTVNMVNNIYQVSDIDSVLSKLSAVVASEMDSKGEGVYV